MECCIWTRRPYRLIGEMIKSSLFEVLPIASIALLSHVWQFLIATPKKKAIVFWRQTSHRTFAQVVKRCSANACPIDGATSGNHKVSCSMSSQPHGLTFPNSMFPTYGETVLLCKRMDGCHIKKLLHFVTFDNHSVVSSFHQYRTIRIDYLLLVAIRN